MPGHSLFSGNVLFPSFAVPLAHPEESQGRDSRQLLFEDHCAAWYDAFQQRGPLAHSRLDTTEARYERLMDPI
jgi:hypothetical protein